MPWIIHSAPRKGRGRMTKSGSPLVASRTTLRAKGPPKPRPMPPTPASQRWRVPKTAGKNSSLTPISRRPAFLSRLNLERAEEVGDLESGCLRRVRAVDGIGLDRGREVLPDRPRGGLGGVGGAHEVAEAGDGALAFQHHGHARALGHEGAEAAVEWPILVDDIEARGLGRREMHELGGQDLEACLLEASDDLPGHVLGDGVGLDDGQGALYGHERERVLVVIW